MAGHLNFFFQNEKTFKNIKPNYIEYLRNKENINKDTKLHLETVNLNITCCPSDKGSILQNEEEALLKEMLLSVME